MDQVIRLKFFFIMLILSISGKTFDETFKKMYDEPNDDPMDLSLISTTTKPTKLSLESMNCIESRRCGCYKGYCWSYIDEYQTPTTGWWCFTQQEGIRGKQKLWAKCTNSSQCSWTMTCGDCYTYVGKRTGIKTDKILC